MEMPPIFDPFLGGKNDQKYQNFENVVSDPLFLGGVQKHRFLTPSRPRDIPPHAHSQFSKKCQNRRFLAPPPKNPKK
jgi:hypothetical protein